MTSIWIQSARRARSITGLEVQCGQNDKLGWSHCWEKGFWCQACHDHLDEDEEMAPVAPPRWDGTVVSSCGRHKKPSELLLEQALGVPTARIPYVERIPFSKFILSICDRF